MAEKKEFKDAHPPKTVQKSTKLMHVHTNVSYASRTVVSFKSHPKCFKACLIQWTTSGEPLIGLKTHQGPKLGHSAVVLYIVLLSWPCSLHLDFFFSFLKRGECWDDFSRNRVGRGWCDDSWTVRSRFNKHSIVSLASNLQSRQSSSEVIVSLPWPQPPDIEVRVSLPSSRTQSWRIRVTWSVWTNQRQLFKSRDQSGPIRGQYLTHLE